VGKRSNLLKQSIKLVIRNIIANKSRNVLTCLGIIIGVSAFLCMSSLNNVSQMIQKMNYSRFGYSNFVYELYDRTLRPVGWTENDIAFFESLEGVKCCDPYINVKNFYTASANGNTFEKVGVEARTANFFKYIPETKLKSGRVFTDEENANGANVCIIDDKIAEKLFGGIDCIGRIIRLGSAEYKVVGVRSHDTGTMDRDTYIGDFSIKGYVAIPYNTVVKMTGLAAFNITVFTKEGNPELVKKAHEDANAYILKYLHMAPEDGGFGDYYFGDSMEEYYAEVSKENNRKRVVSLICLLVGGIGIMNMMLVSVAERRREIGLRKALGATESKIQVQFLLESVILSTVGGLVGATVGIVFTMIVDVISSFLLTGMMERTVVVTYVDWGGLIFGLFSSVFVGALFGYLPARKASRMNPIDALKI